MINVEISECALNGRSILLFGNKDLRPSQPDTQSIVLDTKDAQEIYDALLREQQPLFILNGSDSLSGEDTQKIRDELLNNSAMKLEDVNTTMTQVVNISILQRENKKLKSDIDEITIVANSNFQSSEIAKAKIKELKIKLDDANAYIQELD